MASLGGMRWTFVILLITVAEGFLRKRGLTCPANSTKIQGPSQYSDDLTCGDIVAAGVNFQDPVYLDECARIMGYERQYIVRDVSVSHCLPFSNGTARYRTEICCPDDLTQKRCYTCKNAHLVKDVLTDELEHDYCNSQDLQTCTTGQICSTRYDYFAAPGGKTRYEVSKGCMKKSECLQARNRNGQSCVSGIDRPSCTFCCNDPLCNKQHYMNKLDVPIDNSDDPCNVNNGLDNPCLNKGSCIASGSTFTCDCADGFHGDLCEYDPCDSPSPCQGKSECDFSLSPPYYKCLCRLGLHGRNCEKEYPECANNICLNGGTCIQQDGSEACRCAEGFVGEFCEIQTSMQCSSPNLYLKFEEEKVDKLEQNKGATCTNKYIYTREKSSSENLVSRCRSRLFPEFRDGVDGNIKKLEVEGSELVQCEKGRGALYYKTATCCPSCMSKPCQNGGWCIQDGVDHVCRCRYGYSGDQCQYRTTVCVMFGDPHYFTADGQHIIYHGTCKHLLASSANAANVPAFQVYGRTEHRHGNTAVAYPSYIEVTVYGFTIRLGRNGLVVVNGEQIHDFTDIRTYANGRVSVQRNGAFITVDTDFGLRVQFDGSLVADVWMPETLTEQTAGLCGNNNGDISDDLTTQSGVDMWGDPARYSKVGNSWQVDDPEDPECQVVEVVDPKKCDDPAFDSIEYCGYIVDPNIDSPFANCLTINPAFMNIFGLACRYDVCSNEGDTDASCGALSALAGACADKGFKVNWRSPHMCPMVCDGGREYVFSGPACEKSCTRPKADELCSLQITETCACPGNQVIKDNKCVDRYECGCIGENGQNLQIGFSWMSKDCETMYTCKYCEDCHDGFGEIIEESHQCPPHESVCQDGKCQPSTTTTTTTPSTTTTTPSTTTTTPTTSTSPISTTTTPPTTTTTPTSTTTIPTTTTTATTTTTTTPTTTTTTPTTTTTTPTTTITTPTTTTTTPTTTTTTPTTTTTTPTTTTSPTTTTAPTTTTTTPITTTTTPTTTTTTPTTTTTTPTTTTTTPTTTTSPTTITTTPTITTTTPIITTTTPTTTTTTPSTTTTTPRTTTSTPATTTTASTTTSNSFTTTTTTTTPAGTCRCYGDPHCTTADGFYFNLTMASCGMTFLRDGCQGGIPTGSENSYEVAVDIDSSGKHWFVEGLRIVTGGHSLEMDSTPLVVTLDGTQVAQQAIEGSTKNNPFVKYDYTMYRTATKRVMIVCCGGVHVEWNFNRRVKAEIPSSQASRTCGICGNSDGNPYNDYVFGPSDYDNRCPAKSGNMLYYGVQAGDRVGMGDTYSRLYALSWYSYKRPGDEACAGSCQELI